MWELQHAVINHLKITENQISIALDWIHNWLAHVPLSLTEKNQVELALEEAIVNALTYGNTNDTLEIFCHITTKAIEFQLRDRGLPFDPLQYPPPDLNLPPQERKEGGLGILLMRSHLDDLHYAREGSENVLTLVKFFSID